MTAKKGKKALSSLAAALFIMSPVCAHANAGLPMLAIVWPLSWIAFIPVVAIEAWIAVKLIHFSWRKSVKACLFANLASTFVGIPLTWFLLVIMEGLLGLAGNAFIPKTMYTELLTALIYAPWLPIFGQESFWMIPVALAYLLIIFGLISVYLERPIFKKVTKCTGKEARRWSWMANGITYALLLLTVLIADWFKIMGGG